MGTITRQVAVAAPAAKVWDAVRDWGRPHERLAPSVLKDCRVEEGARIVTFANGMAAKELIVAVDDEAMRLVWAIVEGRPLHHNGAMQVFADGEASRVVWTSDFLPDEFGPLSAPLMEAALADLARTLKAPGSS